MVNILRKGGIMNRIAAASLAAGIIRPTIPRKASDVFIDARSGEQYQFDEQGYIPFELAATVVCLRRRRRRSSASFILLSLPQKSNTHTHFRFCQKNSYADAGGILRQHVRRPGADAQQYLRGPGLLVF